MLDYEFFGNEVSAWLVALTAAALSYVALALVRHAVADRLGRTAKATPTFADDALLEVLHRTRVYFLIAVAAWIGSRALDLSRSHRTFLGRALILLVLLQVGRWAAHLVSLWVARFTAERTVSGDIGSITTVRALGYATKAMAWLLLGITALETVFDYDVTALVTGLGIVGIAVALAVQNILGDLIAALSIVLDKPFVVGDYIVVGEFQGSVEQIGLKTTRIRGLGGEQVIFSNAELLKSSIRNFKRMYERRVAIPFEVHLETSRDALAGLPAAVRAIVEAQSPVRFDRCHVVGITDRSFRIETVYFVLDPDHATHMDIQQRVILETLAHLDEKGVRLARTLLEEKLVVA